MLTFVREVVFFFAVAPPGLFRPDVVHQTFFLLARRVRRGRSKKRHHPGLAEIAPAHSE